MKVCKTIISIFQNHKDFLQLLINASKGKENNNAAETKGELTYEDYKATGCII